MRSNSYAEKTNSNSAAQILFFKILEKQLRDFFVPNLCLRCKIFFSFSKIWNNKSHYFFPNFCSRRFPFLFQKF